MYVHCTYIAIRWQHECHGSKKKKNELNDFINGRKSHDATSNYYYYDYKLYLCSSFDYEQWAMQTFHSLAIQFRHRSKLKEVERKRKQWKPNEFVTYAHCEYETCDIKHTN